MWLDWNINCCLAHMVCTTEKGQFFQDFTRGHFGTLIWWDPFKDVLIHGQSFFPSWQNKVYSWWLDPIVCIQSLGQKGVICELKWGFASCSPGNFPCGVGTPAQSQAHRFPQHSGQTPSWGSCSCQGPWWPSLSSSGHLSCWGRLPPSDGTQI